MSVVRGCAGEKPEPVKDSGSQRGEGMLVNCSTAQIEKVVPATLSSSCLLFISRCGLKISARVCSSRRYGTN
jgi:hypothetical protein